MIQIIANQIFERSRLVFGNGLESDLIERVFAPLLCEHGLRNDRNYAHEMQVIPAPEIDQVRPEFVVIFLRVDPLVAVVTWKREIVSELGADEALMIIRGGVDQVTENLL
jgi:hypothetical protein